MDQTCAVDICFGTSKKWTNYQATLSCITQSLNLVICKDDSEPTGPIRLKLSQNICLDNLVSCYSVYHNNQKPYCLDLVRQRGLQRISISFQTATIKEEWRDRLLHHVQRETALLTSIIQVNTTPVSIQGGGKILPESAQSSLNKNAESEEEVKNSWVSDNLSDDDSGIYESIENYAKLPELPKKNLVKSSSSNLETSPPLPERRKMTDTQRRLHELFCETNRLLEHIHELTELLEIESKNIDDTIRESTVDVGLLIDLRDSENSIHFDSIPIPSYHSPAVPHRNVVIDDYMMPVNETLAKAEEPIYAKINKKRKPATVAISNNVQKGANAPKAVG